jgi:ankyrin repeat protein
MLLLLALATPVAAQFSDSYNFLKAVRDRDVLKAKSFLDKPGSTLVNARDGDTGETALHIAVRRRDTPWMGFLLQNGADANVRDRDGATPMMLAAGTGFAEGVRVMTAVKAQVDASNPRGETALIKAIHARDAASVRLLLEAGADPDRADSLAGLSARDYALRDARNTEAGRLLAAAPRRETVKAVGPQL